MQLIEFKKLIPYKRPFADCKALVGTRKKRTFPDFSENVLYISLIFVLHTCCICVAYRLKSSTSDNFPQPL